MGSPCFFSCKLLSPSPTISIPFPAQSKAPRLPSPRPSIIHTDPWKRPDLASRHAYPTILKPQLVPARYVEPIQRPIDLQGTAEPSRSINQFTIDLNRPDQHGGGKAGSFRYYIQTVVHAVDQIDVGNSWRTEKNFCPGRSPLRRMAGFVSRADIGLDLDDLSGYRSLPVLPHEIFAYEAPRHDERRSLKISIG